MAVTKGISKLEDPGAFRCWAYTIVSRKAADWLRGRRVREAEGPLTEEHLAAPPAASENGAVGLLREALRRLPGERRALINLRYVEGFEIREMAEILGVPEGTVKSRLHSARQQLQDTVERMDR